MWTVVFIKDNFPTICVFDNLEEAEKLFLEYAENIYGLNYLGSNDFEDYKQAFLDNGFLEFDFGNVSISLCYPIALDDFKELCKV